jgi:hypothetical protein
MVLDIPADRPETETLSAKIRPHRLSQLSDDVISQLGQPPLFPLSRYLLNIYSGQTSAFAEEQVAPSTVVADKEPGEGQLHRPPLPPYPSFPSTGRGTFSQLRSHMPDVSNRQTLPTMSEWSEWTRMG